jgi:hypothetical protein
MQLSRNWQLDANERRCGMKSEYEKKNEELCETIRRMREEMDPAKVDAFDKKCVRQLEELRGKLKAKS